MGLHQASGRWRLGLGLSLTAALSWATLPVALKIALEQVDAVTLTWFRFLVAALVTAAWLGWRGGLGGYRALSSRHRRLLALAGVMLLGNYLFFLLGVDRTSPANAQLIIQLAPLLMAFGGIVVFGERFGAAQWMGLCLLLGGLGLFFFDQLLAQGQDTGAQARDGRYAVGSAFVALAAVVWAVYALLQKQLLMRLSSMQVLLAIYVLCALLLWPFAAPATLLRLDAAHAWAVAYCALSTIMAYSAFAEALVHWEASRVSAVIAGTPLLCIAAAAAAHALWPAALAPERIGALGYAGAALVVGGSAAVSLLRARTG